MTDHDIHQLTVRQFLTDDHYVIPIYQRNYDWGEREALQLIEDIADYAQADSHRPYYIGSAIVFVRHQEGRAYFETIDGQQRLTTLTILASLLHAQGCADWYGGPNLSYDHRREADEALRGLRERRLSDHPAAQNIVDVFTLMDKNLPRILAGKGLTCAAFADYLFNQVVIMRIPVPKDTDLNHYFEIMNSRGEQLEKHEVLKASLMSHLDRREHALFDTLWEACADMTAYVQMNFRPRMRQLLFGSTWTDFLHEDFDTLLACADEDADDGDNETYVSRTLDELFADARANVRYDLPDDGTNDDNERQDRFGSIINFPNFLLQALKVMYHSDPARREDIGAGIKLDDKRLIPIFQSVLAPITDKRAFVKRFIMALLHIRRLYDRYVIKREYHDGRESWSLKDIRKYDRNKAGYVSTFGRGGEDESDEGRDVRMLQAMFHVSAPTQIYKHWLNAVLLYVYRRRDGDIAPSDLRQHLYRLACTYMLDRYLTPAPIDFEDIIYTHDGHAANHTIHWAQIDQGCNVENFIFNFYDYVTWRQHPQQFSRFEFTYRTSVEHFYPQTPMDGYKPLTAETGLDDFGNLCLISRGMNSKFSNNMPVAKLNNFGRNEVVAGSLSLKLLEMMDITARSGKWNVPEIAQFEQQARTRILSAIRQGCEEEVTEIT